jgi:hypothetical protein
MTTARATLHRATATSNVCAEHKREEAERRLAEALAEIERLKAEHAAR